MSPEQQRISIAEACGWTNVVESWHTSGRYGAKNTNGIYKNLPDYLNDLNAMHEAEKHLLKSDSEFYQLKLKTITIREIGMDTEFNYFHWIHATAAHRAEAFLKTLNLWKL